MGNMDFGAADYRCVWGIGLTSLADGKPVASWKKNPSNRDRCICIYLS
jgi:hypothetical protein